MKSSPIAAELHTSISELAARIEGDPMPPAFQTNSGAPVPPDRSSRRVLLAVAAAVVVAAGIGIALTTASRSGSSDQTASIATTSGAPTTPDRSGRASTYITSFDDLIATADSVVVVTVAADDTSDTPLIDGELVSKRTITAEVEDVLAGTSVQSPVQINVASEGDQAGAGPLSSKVGAGERFIFVLASQPDGTFELNGSAAYFPLDAPERAAELASTRAEALDPGVQSIGRATQDVSDDDLIALIDAMP